MKSKEKYIKLKKEKEIVTVRKKKIEDLLYIKGKQNYA